MCALNVVKGMKLYMDVLNEKQGEAINFKEGPCLVLAGAGSGKTKVLTERIIKLIEDGVSPQNILAITFTNKAAKEMKDRISLKLDNVANNIFVGTFHSFGLKIIRENFRELGFERNISIIDKEDMNSIIKKILKEYNVDTKLVPIKYVINKISFAKNENLTPEEYSKFMKGYVDETVIKVFTKYISVLKSNNSVDFDDLLLLPLQLFKNNKTILDKYQEHYKYILVDEYQDTNTVQYDLCKVLASKYKNIFVVGDIDQSIYGWRGANYENILNFEKDYKEAHLVILEENYRSTKNILDAANSVVKHNVKRKEKKLISTKDLGEKIKYIRCYSEIDEAKEVVEEIKKLVLSGKKYSDIGILYRTNAQSRVIEEALLKENIPYKVVGSYYFYNRKEIKDLIAYLTLIYNPKDNESLERIINVPKRKIGNKTIEKIREKANDAGISMFEAIKDGSALDFKNLILKLIDESKKLNLSDLIDQILNLSGMKNELETMGDLDSEIRLENLEEFKSIALAFEERGIYSLEEFLENIALVSDFGQYKEVDDCVNVMTLHSAKGLEFDVVFLTGMEENVFPHFRSMDNEDELEEERRLCYVGITRAKEKLYLLNAKKRTLFGRTDMNSPSRFVQEITPDLLDSSEVNVNAVVSNDMYDEERNSELKVGDKVKHTKYGYGIVVQIEGSIASIAFNHNVGVVKIMKTHKSLEKVDNLEEF